MVENILTVSLWSDITIWRLIKLIGYTIKGIVDWENKKRNMKANFSIARWSPGVPSCLGDKDMSLRN